MKLHQWWSLPGQEQPFRITEIRSDGWIDMEDIGGYELRVRECYLKDLGKLIMNTTG